MRLAGKLIFTCLLVIFIGCSGSKRLADTPLITIDKKDFRIPAGVDSSVAYNSKMKAERLFVNTKREQIADSLNKNFFDYLRITEELYNLLEKKKEEFKKIRQEFRESTKNFSGQNTLSLEEKRKYEKAFEQIAEDSLTISIVTSLLDYYLNYCSENFQQAYKLNPFDLNILINTAICDWDRGLIFKDTLANRSAIQSLMKVLNYNRGVASVYKEIGKNYFEMKNWKRAHEYLSKAQQIYVLTSIFDNPNPDTSEMHKKGNIPLYVKPEEYYDYLLRKGRAEIKVYEADSALATLEMALYLAPSKQDSSLIKYLVNEWIKWDDGNIYAAEQKAIIEDSLIHGKYEWAKNAYIRLLPQLKTKEARDNITWRLARVEFSYLEQPEQAADRLYNLVINADTSKNKTNVYKAPADSLYKVYFKDCGEVLFGLGNKYRDEGIYDKARQYFRKDTTFEWAGRGKAFLPLAQLIEVPENIPPQERVRIYNRERIRILTRAKSFIKDFTDKEIDFLYRPLIQIYRSQRDMKNAEKNFREWIMLKEQLKSKS